MIVQKADSDCSGTLPPPGIHAPLWGELVKQWNTIPPPVHVSVELGPEVILIGRDDCELDDCAADEVSENHEFGWDNENPCRQVKVGKFKINFRPITVKEFYEFWVGETYEKKVSSNLPANWVEDKGEIKVCLV